MTDYAKSLDTSEVELNTGATISPHPDGLPWIKCCGNKHSCQCAYRRRKRDGISRMDDFNKDGFSKNAKHYAQTIAEGGRFFCAHRTEDGHHRVCAGYHARDRRE